MEEDPDPPGSVLHEVTFSDLIRAAEDAIKVQILESGEGEAHQGACEDEKENKIVTLGEANRVVNLSSDCNKPIRRRERRRHVDSREIDKNFW